MSNITRVWLNEAGDLCRKDIDPKDFYLPPKQETHAEGKSRCLDLLASLSGQSTDDEKALRIKKENAHFDAKSRL